MDRKFAFEGRNVAFVIDNCPAHSHIDNLKAIKLYFLPPNTISKTQPMDQGVLRSLKAKYRKNVARKIIQRVEKKKALPKISLLQGMQMLVSAWDVLSTQTIANCFRKSGISTESQEIAIAEDDNPFRVLQDKIGDLRSIQPNFIEEDFDATTFAAKIPILPQFPCVVFAGGRVMKIFNTVFRDCGKNMVGKWYFQY